jgi:hypothetical protein
MSFEEVESNPGDKISRKKFLHRCLAIGIFMSLTLPEKKGILTHTIKKSIEATATQHQNQHILFQIKIKP